MADLAVLVYCVVTKGFHKMPAPRQPELIQPEHLIPRLKWKQLFFFLPQWPEDPPKRGRRPVDRNALLRASIYQRLTGQRFLTQLCSQLGESPPLVAALGFDPYCPPPPLERFSSFLADTDYTAFLWVFVCLVQELLDAGVIKAEHVGFDSCAIPSWVRENNLKTAFHHARYDKNIPPKADPDARLGVRIHFPSPEKKKVHYFWGYRHHALVDLEAELPLWGFTEPCNIGETTLAIPLLDAAAVTFGLHFTSVCGDAEYDSEKIIRYIQDTIEAGAYIPKNIRNAGDQEGFTRKNQEVFCPANLKMYRHGKMTVKGITYIQYCCPFYKGTKPDLLICPVDHPKFHQQKGCNHLWRLTDNPREKIPYGTTEFKTNYNRRTAVERVFSRLRAITLQEPAVRGLASVRNHCIISDIAVLLVALAAWRLEKPDKIRFLRTFVPYVLD